MTIAVGVIVRRIKEKIYAQTGQYTIELNDKVIIETEHGVEFGVVCEKEKNIEQTKDLYVGKVVRKANEYDFKRLLNNESKNHQAHAVVSKEIKDHKLDMKLTYVQYTFDRTKLFIYYTSETRVDFRELIKDLGHVLKTRIQMVQIGVRDESKIVGGIGTCGQQLCCQIFLKDFSSVTIDMAKDQDLSLNTAKLSGLCGRLMCCLSYEHEQYLNIKKNSPSIGSRVSTPNGKGKVISLDCVKESVNVELGENNVKPYKISQIKQIEEKDKDKEKETKEKK
ncbi:MAG: regulatory iron-sulfur-containing complex subunit RicT [Endomicrobiaceae bacterium]|jgi:cell fate regulator YaaT (PSP1 superfamily)|nr:regulatory iron-sulfur-containing complex subunit RicT [Endomicrobiaceae bacterium]MDD3053339.1 regulatory iron-sulfur-containing complex subunit RicT [Endomicrobiaceae bacterium]MDD3922264.1 regulatory iron-sulfur-containing complex subunit RicT [Endomicrobiaceae bacterium]